MNEEKMNELMLLCYPVIEWLVKNACPHDKLEIDIGGVSFLEGKFFVPNKEL